MTVPEADDEKYGAEGMLEYISKRRYCAGMEVVGG